MQYLYSFIFLLFTSISVSAQPETWGCHQVHRHAAQFEPTAEELEWRKRSLERSDSFDILHYDITVDVTKFSEKLLQAKTTVYFSPKMDNLSELNLDLEGLTVLNVSSGIDSLSYTYNGRILKISLPDTVSSGELDSVTVRYEGTPITCPSGFGGFYFEEGYAYNLGIGLAADPHNFGRAWFPCFDNFVERSTYTYTMISNGGKIGYSVGELISQEISGNTITRTFHMEDPIPTYLSHVAISEYTDVDQVHQSVYGPLPVRLVSRPGDTSEFKSSFAALGEAIDCMEYWYGKYSFDLVGYTITPRGAMEHPTAVAYPDNSIVNGNPNNALMTHELAHHWWGNTVTLTTQANMWIKEGPASYAPHMLEEWLDGEEDFLTAVRSNHRSVMQNAHIADGRYLPLSPMPKDVTYGMHTYDKGAAMIHNLRTYMGDELFRESMQYVLDQKMWSHMDAETFRDLLEEASNLELSHFFNDWIFAPGWSDFLIEELTYNEDIERVEVSIAQYLREAPHYHTEVPLEIAFYDSTWTPHTFSVTVSDSITNINMLLGFNPVFAVPNPRNSLNLASFTYKDIVFEDRSVLPDANLLVEAENVKDSALIYLEHHWVKPLRDTTGDITFNPDHFWRFHMEGHADYSASYRYREGVEPDESALIAIGTDSLILLYRLDAQTEWLEYPHYTINKLSPSTGFVRISKLVEGDYILGLGNKPLHIKEKEQLTIEVSPNPVADQLFISGVQEWTGSSLYLFTAEGRKLHEEEITPATSSVDVSGLLSGSYILYIEGKENYASQLIEIAR